MTIRIEEQGVRVDPEGWRALVEGTAPERGQVISLPGLDLAVTAAEAPEARLHLDVVTPGGRRTHLAWVTRRAVALLVEEGGGELRRLLALPPDRLPSALARLVGLGPRPGADGEAEVLSDDQAARLWDPEQDALTEIGADRAWTLTLTPASGLVVDALTVLAVDGPGGVRLVGVDPEASALDAGEVHLTPVTPTTVWRLLAGLLPALGGAE